VGFEIGLGPGEGRVGGIVFGAVVDEQDFPAESGVVFYEEVDGFGEHEGEAEGFVVGGDDDGDVDWRVGG